ncbi:hypothetical protein MTO96_002764 [Rhipicephalus appendiculatus]
MAAGHPRTAAESRGGEGGVQNRRNPADVLTMPPSVLINSDRLTIPPPRGRAALGFARKPRERKEEKSKGRGRGNSPETPQRSRIRSTPQQKAAATRLVTRSAN